jgi:hypothetical protein
MKIALLRDSIFGADLSSVFGSPAQMSATVNMSREDLLSLPQKGAQEEMPRSKGVIISDHFAVHVRQPKDQGQGGDHSSGSNDRSGNSRLWQVGQFELRRTLVN